MHMFVHMYTHILGLYCSGAILSNEANCTIAWAGVWIFSSEHADGEHRGARIERRAASYRGARMDHHTRGLDETSLARRCSPSACFFMSGKKKACLKKKDPHRAAIRAIDALVGPAMASVNETTLEAPKGCYFDPTTQELRFNLEGSRHQPGRYRTARDL